MTVLSVSNHGARVKTLPFAVMVKARGNDLKPVQSGQVITQFWGRTIEGRRTFYANHPFLPATLISISDVQAFMLMVDAETAGANASRIKYHNQIAGCDEYRLQGEVAIRGESECLAMMYLNQPIQAIDGAVIGVGEVSA